MARHGKRYRADAQNVKTREPLPLDQAIETVKSFSKTKFDQTVEIAMHLGIDPTHADQMVRSSVSLPHGIGKSKRVIAFCGEDKVAEAKESGAIEAGGEELVEKIEGGWMEFDVAVASPDMMRVVSRLGRVLGPKGLMPSPKAGTVTPHVAQAVKEYAAGKVEFRADKGGNVHGIVGKMSFDSQALKENAETFIETVEKLRPSAVKAQYVKSVSLSGAMTPGVRVAV